MNLEQVLSYCDKLSSNCTAPAASNFDAQRLQRKIEHISEHTAVINKSSVLVLNQNGLRHLSKITTQECLAVIVYAENVQQLLQQTQNYIGSSLEQDSSGCTFLKSNDLQVLIPVLFLNQEQVWDLLNSIYQHPFDNAFIIGVTGTKGKSSCSWIAAQLLELEKNNPLYIGTDGFGSPSSGLSKHTFSLTTQTFIQTMTTFATHQLHNDKVLVMEVSSHGIAQQRVKHIPFNCVVHTGLGTDHIDYHGSFAEYKNVKLNFMYSNKAACQVWNSSCDQGAAEHKAKVLCYGENDTDHLHLADFTEHLDGTSSAKVTAKHTSVLLNFNFWGKFNALNVLAGALAVTQDEQKALLLLEKHANKLQLPKGRLERISEHGIYIDYAHTPESLEQVLSTLRQNCKGKLILCIGCGGERWVGKRLEMARISEKYSDLIFFTADNSRREKTEKIVGHMISAISCLDKLKVNYNRAESIISALHCKSKNDIVLIAGRGAESYMNIAQTNYEFSDRQVVNRYLETLVA